MPSIRHVLNVLLLALSVAVWATVTSGCAGVVVAGAGAAAGIAYTDRGAKGEAKGNVADVNRRAVAVFQRAGLKTTETQIKDAGNKRSLEGKHGDKDVSVSMNRSSANTTEVEVVAREGTVKWNKDYAKSILRQILEQG